jgi:hypothetical protein
MVQAPMSLPKDEIRCNRIAGPTVNPAVQPAIGAQSGDGKPTPFVALAGTFDFTDEEFSERFLPWVRLSFAFLQRDYTGVEQLVHDMVRQRGKECLNEADTALTGCAEVFSAITEFVEAARVRLAIVRGQHQLLEEHAAQLPRQL